MHGQSGRTIFSELRNAFTLKKIKLTFHKAKHVFTEYSRVHQALIALTIFILINNTIIVSASYNTPNLPNDVIVSDPYEIADTVRLLAGYTPSIDENPDEIAYSLEESINGGFITPSGIIASGPSNIPAGEGTPIPSTDEEQRGKDVKYAVQIGDTISGIGVKFNLKMATIQVKNNLSDLDSIKPGQELVIPPQDLSEKALKAAEDRKKASAELAQSGTKKIISSSSGNFGFIVPVRHNGISRGLVGGHTGIDYRANVGTPVVAAIDGVVLIADESGWNGGFGKTILISHGNGLTTRYGHLSDVRISVGAHVGKGQVVGLSGNSGRSTGPHLHFEARKNGAVRSPF